MTKTRPSTLTDTRPLRSTVAGDVIAPGDANYDAARTIWNAMIDRRPAVIVRCAGPDDVAPAIRFARDHDLDVSVRGGGHNIAGHALVDDGLVIDLSRMRDVAIDAARRRARVGPGATLGMFDTAAQEHGLATPVGINSTTGVAGLTLGGGFGWLTRKHGMTIDNLVAADITTADGTAHHVSDADEPDLFWAIRGGGGNFGVVTRFEFALHPLGPDVLAGLLVFPYEQARHVLHRYRDFVQSAPEDLNVWAILRQAPPLPFLPPRVHGTPILALAVFHAGDPAAGSGAVDDLRRFGDLLGEHVGVQPYVAWQQAFDPLLTPGARNYWKSHNFTELADGAVDCMIEYGARLPSPQCEIFVGLIAGAANRVPAAAMAYGHRDARFVMNVHGRWDAGDDDARCIEWARRFFRAAAPYASAGAYVNFMTEDEADRVAAAYGPNYRRLVALKREYDPDNVFHSNQNIAP
jgi:FAD/FMN-containing dehydrogenase